MAEATINPATEIQIIEHCRPHPRSVREKRK
jgi:hypothetical protein